MKIIYSIIGIITLGICIYFFPDLVKILNKVIVEITKFFLVFIFGFAFIGYMFFYSMAPNAIDKVTDFLHGKE